MADGGGGRRARDKAVRDSVQFLLLCLRAPAFDGSSSIAFRAAQSLRTAGLLCAHDGRSGPDNGGGPLARAASFITAATNKVPMSSNYTPPPSPGARHQARAARSVAISL